MPMPAGSPRAMTNRWLASTEEGIVVLRLLLLGLLVVGLATGFRHQWLQVNWNRLLEDVGLGDPEQEPFDFNRWLIGDPDAEPRSD